MTISKDVRLLSSDKPVKSPGEDLLGYSSFANHLANSIVSMTPTDGLVIAIYGPWGSGKTSLLNLIQNYIGQQPKKTQPIIVPFNPWWFSGHEDLTRIFFTQLQATFQERRIGGEKLRQQIADFTDLVSKIPLPYASTGEVVSRLVKPTQKSIPELKRTIAETLSDRKRRILVIIDDIDRLTAEEIRQLFRVIKAIADFPNIVYLLAFDKEVAVQSLTNMQEGFSGEAYLEKIIQVPFELPLPDKISLRNMIFEKLNSILIDLPNELFDQTYWGNIYLEGIEHFITTPRDIVRLTNTLSVTYPAVRDEVNPVDFIAIETIRVFCPLIYDIIRKNPEYFIGHSRDANSRINAADHLQSFHNSWLAQIDESTQEPVKRLLSRLFPKIESIWGPLRYHYGSEWEITWRRQLRVCSADIAPVYFRLAVPEGALSRIEMESILALSNDVQGFGAQLITLANQQRPDGSTRVAAFLERLEDYTDQDILETHIPFIVHALFDVGDQLLRPEDENRGMFSFGNSIKIARILRQLLRRLDRKKRFDLLCDAVKGGDSLSTVIYEIRILRQEQSKYESKMSTPEEEWFVSAKELEVLESLALERIRNTAENGSLIEIPKFPRILYGWKDLAGEDEVKRWIDKVISDDAGLVALLEAFLQKSFMYGMTDSVGRIGYDMDLQSLTPFFDPVQVIERVRNLSTRETLSENQKLAVENYIRAYEAGVAAQKP